MSKQDLIDMLNYLIDQIVFASDCLLAYNSIYLCSQKYNYATHQAPGFFKVVSHSLPQTLMMTLARLYDVNSNDITLARLVQKSAYYAETESDTESRPYISNLLEWFSHKKEEMEQVIEKLRDRRRKMYAHNDKIIASIKQFGIDSSLYISPSDAGALISVASTLCNGLLSQLGEDVMVPFSQNSSDLANLLSKIPAE